MVHFIIIVSGDCRNEDILDGFITEEAADLPCLGLLGGGFLSAAFNAFLAGKKQS